MQPSMPIILTHLNINFGAIDGDVGMVATILSRWCNLNQNAFFLCSTIRWLFGAFVFRINILIIFGVQHLLGFKSEIKARLNNEGMVWLSCLLGLVWSSFRALTESMLANECKTLAIIKHMNIHRTHILEPLFAFIRHSGNTVIITGSYNDVSFGNIQIYEVFKFVWILKCIKAFGNLYFTRLLVDNSNVDSSEVPIFILFKRNFLAINCSYNWNHNI